MDPTRSLSVYPMDISLDMHERMIDNMNSSMSKTKKRLNNTELILNLRPSDDEPLEMADWDAKVDSLLNTHDALPFPKLYLVKREHEALAASLSKKKSVSIQEWNVKAKDNLLKQIDHLQTRVMQRGEQYSSKAPGTEIRTIQNYNGCNTHHTQSRTLFRKESKGWEEPGSSLPPWFGPSYYHPNATNYNPGAKSDNAYQVAFKSTERNSVSACKQKRETNKRRKDEIQALVEQQKAKELEDLRASLNSRGGRSRNQPRKQQLSLEESSILKAKSVLIGIDSDDDAFVGGGEDHSHHSNNPFLTTYEDSTSTVSKGPIFGYDTDGNTIATESYKGSFGMNGSGEDDNYTLNSAMSMPVSGVKQQQQQQQQHYKATHDHNNKKPAQKQGTDSNKNKRSGNNNNVKVSKSRLTLQTSYSIAYPTGDDGDNDGGNTGGIGSLNSLNSAEYKHSYNDNDNSNNNDNSNDNSNNNGDSSKAVFLSASQSDSTLKTQLFHGSIDTFSPHGKTSKTRARMRTHSTNTSPNKKAHQSPIRSSLPKKINPLYAANPFAVKLLGLDTQTHTNTSVGGSVGNYTASPSSRQQPQHHFQVKDYTRGAFATQSASQNRRISYEYEPDEAEEKAVAAVLEAIKNCVDDRIPKIREATTPQTPTQQQQRQGQQQGQGHQKITSPSAALADTLTGGNSGGGISRMPSRNLYHAPSGTNTPVRGISRPVSPNHHNYSPLLRQSVGGGASNNVVGGGGLTTTASVGVKYSSPIFKAPNINYNIPAPKSIAQRRPSMSNAVTSAATTTKTSFVVDSGTSSAAAAAALVAAVVTSADSQTPAVAGLNATAHAAQQQPTTTEQPALTTAAAAVATVRTMNSAQDAVDGTATVTATATAVESSESINDSNNNEYIESLLNPDRKRPTHNVEDNKHPKFTPVTLSRRPTRSDFYIAEILGKSVSQPELRRGSMFLRASSPAQMTAIGTAASTNTTAAAAIRGSVLLSRPNTGMKTPPMPLSAPNIAMDATNSISVTQSLDLDVKDKNLNISQSIREWKRKNSVYVPTKNDLQNTGRRDTFLKLHAELPSIELSLNGLLLEDNPLGMHGTKDSSRTTNSAHSGAGTKASRERKSTLDSVKTLSSAGGGGSGSVVSGGGSGGGGCGRSGR